MLHPAVYWPRTPRGAAFMVSSFQWGEALHAERALLVGACGYFLSGCEEFWGGPGKLSGAFVRIPMTQTVRMETKTTVTNTNFLGVGGDPA